MATCPRPDTVDLLEKPAGSDNVWPVAFAKGKLSETDPNGRDEQASAGTVAQPLRLVKRLCRVCETPLRRKQKMLCGQSCRGKWSHMVRPRTGRNNPNFKGWRSRRPYSSYTRAFKRQHPEIVRAHGMVGRAVRSGALVRPAVCSSCGKGCRPDAHHVDYAKPLDVQWLCRKCHRAADAARNSAAEIAKRGYLLDDLCALLKVSRRVVERLRANGAFPIPELASLDARPRWSVAAVEAFLASGHVVTSRRGKRRRVVSHVPTIDRGRSTAKPSLVAGQPDCRGGGR